jgi:uncharacterized membrane protein YqgA involved in biofilm formation
MQPLDDSTQESRIFSHRIEKLDERMEKLDGRIASMAAESHTTVISLVRLEERLKTLSEHMEEQNTANQSIKSAVISAVIVAIAGTIVSLATLGLRLGTQVPVPQAATPMIQR